MSEEDVLGSKGLKRGSEEAGKPKRWKGTTEAATSEDFGWLLVQPPIREAIAVALGSDWMEASRAFAASRTGWLNRGGWEEEEKAEKALRQRRVEFFTYRLVSKAFNAAICTAARWLVGTNGCLLPRTLLLKMVDLMLVMAMEDSLARLSACLRGKSLDEVHDASVEQTALENYSEHLKKSTHLGWGWVKPSSALKLGDMLGCVWRCALFARLEWDVLCLFYFDDQHEIKDFCISERLPCLTVLEFALMCVGAGKLMGLVVYDEDIAFHRQHMGTATSSFALALCIVCGSRRSYGVRYGQAWTVLEDEDFKLGVSPNNSPNYPPRHCKKCAKCWGRERADEYLYLSTANDWRTLRQLVKLSEDGEEALASAWFTDIEVKYNESGQLGNAVTQRYSYDLSSGDKLAPAFKAARACKSIWFYGQAAPAAGAKKVTITVFEKRLARLFEDEAKLAGGDEEKQRAEYVVRAIGKMIKEDSHLSSSVLRARNDS